MAEPARQRGLFEEGDVDEVEGDERSRPTEKDRCEKKRGLRKENKDHAGDHRVPHEAIWPGDDEGSRRIPRRERAAAAGGEVVNGAHEERETDRAEENPRTLETEPERRVRWENVRRTSTQEVGRDEDRDREGKREKRDQMADKRDHEAIRAL